MVHDDHLLRSFRFCTRSPNDRVSNTKIMYEYHLDLVQVHLDLIQEYVNHDHLNIETRQVIDSNDHLARSENFGDKN